MFDGILQSLVDSLPGARGAVFCDSEGETVQSVGASGRSAPELRDDFDLRVAGAQLATPLEGLRHAAELGERAELCVTGSRETLLVRTLPDGYYLVLCLEPAAVGVTPAALAQRRLQDAAERIREAM